MKDLVEALNNLYVKEDNPSSERAEEKVTTERMPGFIPKRELYEIGNKLDLVVEYKKKALYVGNVDLGVCIPFEDIPNLINFLAWFIDSRDIGKE